MVAGIVLAAGKGTRFGAQGFNKTTVLLHGKPLVRYGVELCIKTCDRTVAVVGTFAESVQKALEGLDVTYAFQDEHGLGTGYAARCGVKELAKLEMPFDSVVIGYGDHMMFYTPSVVNQLQQLVREGVTVAMVTTHHEEPSNLRWGRIVRSESGEILAIVEEKEATDEQKAITELNAGFYCVEWNFLKYAVDRLNPAAVSGEYYLTDIVGMAVEQGKLIQAVTVDFDMVGYGVNTQAELERSESLVQA